MLGDNKKKPTIGLALIAKNEEAVIERCIASCKGVDQVSLVDTGSTDRTVEIAKSLGAIVDDTTFKWPDAPDSTGVDFSAARNRSADMLSTDWFMFLDADEVLEKGHIWNIKKHLQEIGDDDMDVILITMYAMDGDEFWREKIVKKKPGLRFVGRVHESFVNENANGIYADDVRIKYEPRASSERNYAILREEVQANVDDMRLQYLMGREEFCFNNCVSSIYWFERYIRAYLLSGKQHKMRYADALFTLALAHAKMADPVQAKYWAAQGFAANPDCREVAQLLADLSLFENNRLANGKWLEIAQLAQNRGMFYKSRGFVKKMESAA